MPRKKLTGVRLDDNYLRVIEELKVKLGIDSIGGLIKHALARLAHEEGVSLKTKTTRK